MISLEKCVSTGNSLAVLEYQRRRDKKGCKGLGGMWRRREYIKKENSGRKRGKINRSSNKEEKSKGGKRKKVDINRGMCSERKKSWWSPDIYTCYSHLNKPPLNLPGISISYVQREVSSPCWMSNQNISLIWSSHWEAAHWCHTYSWSGP